MTAFHIVDVFTGAAFAGNPLAVISDARGLEEARLQKIAREFNFSETTFVYPPEIAGDPPRVRIFTPMTEVPFAGHPTIGTAVVLAALGHDPEMVLQLGVGPIPVTVNGRRAEFATEVPLNVGVSPEVADVAACLGLKAEDIATGRHGPVAAGVGLDFVLVELASDAALAAAAPQTKAFVEAQARYQISLDFAVLAYRRTGSKIRARMFAPLDGVPEDPATGSAAAALTAYLAGLEGRDVALTIDQGIEMGRPSRIETACRTEGGAPVETRVAGEVTFVAEGRLPLD
ncbi:PhzF family phenazine biosynthesis protein [Ovoidimarina sediminis]|uniref:PhzF family phenazine biosynthesis protein n=1 Tax=Ovoidimarina sediminis TaxID=3079856 RepID=UPI0029069333|nr:PhzF family phenazine biosynthesis protein [Rhodophyticola sp. MJ-SS7]MDU8945672.1 PhzF family phenazine biosynthesis protein [Rhodophyticola sp. MJ-SS7]